MVALAEGRRSVRLRRGGRAGRTRPGPAVATYAIGGATSGWLYVYEGRGDGTFSERDARAIGSAPADLLVDDFNGDAISDLAILDKSGELRVLLGEGSQGRGTGRMLARLLIQLGSGTNDLATGDFDVDGRRDLAVTRESAGTVLVLRGEGDGRFEAPVAYRVGGTPGSLLAADLDDDGIVDLAFARGPGVGVLFGRGARGHGDGTFDFTLISAESASALVSGALDADGLPELVALDSAGSTARVLTNGSERVFTPGAAAPLDAGDAQALLADLDADGRLDLAVAQGRGGVSVHRGDGDSGRRNGRFVERAAYGTGFEGTRLAAADFDGDGALDLAASGMGAQFTWRMQQGRARTLEGVSMSSDDRSARSKAPSTRPGCRKVPGPEACACGGTRR